MAKKIIKTEYHTTGSGGWIEGREAVKIPMTKLVSQSTGRSITMPGHEDSYSGKEIRENICRRYPKEYRQAIHGKSNADLENDFQ